MGKISKNQRLLKGLTLIELIIIVTVILILALFTYTQIEQRGAARGRDVKRVSEINNLRTALQLYYMDFGEYPTSTENEEWCSVEGAGGERPECTTLIEKLAPYLAEIPEDPLFGEEKEPEEILYSYQYISTSSGAGYKLHTDLETEEPYEIGSMIAYVPPSPPLPDCGNGNLDAGEACDDGVDNGNCSLYPGVCNANCSGTMICGNDTDECGEVCDDGNTIDCDGCSPDCSRAQPICGDNILECGEFCDDNNTVPCDGCSPDCSRAQPICGDNILECGESCDDGDNNNNDSCPDGTGGSCEPAYCSDGFLWNQDGGSEECDDGNTENGDGCDENCMLETICDRCVNCNTMIANANPGETVTLTRNISDHVGTCIDFNGKDSITFDCDGHTIDGDNDNVGVGIDLYPTGSESSNYNTIKNCYIKEFSSGLTLHGSDNNIFNIVSNDNYHNGFWFFNSYRNTITNITSNNNGYAGIEMQQVDHNTLINSRIENNNDYGIRLYWAGTIGPNKFYNNLFNNTDNFRSIDPVQYNEWNTSTTPGPNIIGGSYIGGNYWTNSAGSGYSDTCIDFDIDGFCDSPYDVYDDEACTVGVDCSVNTDYFPLSGNGGPAGYCIQTAGADSQFTFMADTVLIPVVSQIDSIANLSHYLVVYGNSGGAIVLEVDADDYSIPSVSEIFKLGYSITDLDISKINDTHYLVVSWFGAGNKAVVLEVDPDDYSISTSSSVFEFSNMMYSAISQIDDPFHYLVVGGTNGLSVVLKVDPDDYSISTSSSIFEFTPGPWTISSLAISQIDLNHYLVVYDHSLDNGLSVVLEVDPDDYSISTSSSVFGFTSDNIRRPTISQIDSDYYLVTYFRNGANAVVLKVDSSNWSISKPGETLYFDNSWSGSEYQMSKIDEYHHVVVYYKFPSEGYSVVLEVDPDDWSVSKCGNPFWIGDSKKSDIAQIDLNHYLVVFEKSLHGWAVILELIPCE